MLNLELARDGLPPTSEQFETLTEAWQAAHNAADVSSQMLAYLGHVHSKRELLDLSECCQATLSALRPHAPRDVLIEAHLPTPGPTIRGNATDLHRVLANLLRNAQEAMGTTRQAIRVSVKTVAVTEISSVNRAPVDWHAREPRYACVEVADTGSGIATIALESLFDPFFSTKFTGRGLGLPVALGIVRAHDGVFTVETAPGQGSAFRAYFPLAHEVLAPRPNSVRAIPQAAAGGTVLLVDDEPGVLQALTRTLERERFTVLQAHDGGTALALVRQRGDEVDCVLCDVSMPTMNGWQVLTALHALAPRLPVILASGYSEAQVLEGEHAERPAAFLSKPYETALLLQTLNHVLSGQTRT